MISLDNNNCGSFNSLELDQVLTNIEFLKPQLLAFLAILKVNYVIGFRSAPIKVFLVSLLKIL